MAGGQARGSDRIRADGSTSEGIDRFSAYLRRCRLERRLSLRQVEKLSESCAERISNSYLAYCETGRLLPSLGKLLTLSRVLGIPLQSFTERLEADREAVPAQDLGQDATWREYRAEGIARAEAGRLQEACACFEKALSMTGHGAEARGATIDLKLDLAIVLKRMSRHYTARDLLEEVLSDPRLDAPHGDRALLQLGGVLREMGRLPIAVMIGREALARAQAAGDKSKEAHAACLLGNALFELEDLEQAAPLYERAVKIFRANGDQASLVTNLANLGNCRARSGRSADGIRLLNEAATIARLNGFDRQVADILGYLGQAYRLQGNLTRAERCLFQSNQLARSRGYHDILFSNAWHLREIAVRLGRTDDAATHLRSLRHHRGRVEGSSVEIRAFDRMMSPADEGADGQVPS